MQKTKAVSLFVIGSVLFCACNSPQPGGEPTRAPSTAVPTVEPTKAPPTATVFEAKTSTPIPPATPTAELTATKTITQLQTEAEKQYPNELVGVVNDKITFLFDKSDDKDWNDKIQTMMRNFTPEARAAIQQSTDLAYAMLTTRTYPTTPAEAEKMLKDYYAAKAAAEKAGKPLTYKVKAYRMDANGNVKYGSFDEPSEEFELPVDGPIVIRQRILAGDADGNLPVTRHEHYYGPQSEAFVVSGKGQLYFDYNLSKSGFNLSTGKSDPKANMLGQMRNPFGIALNDINPTGKAKAGPTGELTIYANLLSKTPILGNKELFK